MGYCQLQLFGGVLVGLYHLEVIDSWSRLQQIPSPNGRILLNLDSTRTLDPIFVAKNPLIYFAYAPFLR